VKCNVLRTMLDNVLLLDVTLVMDCVDIVRDISTNSKLGGMEKCWGGCKHARSTNLH